jgi:hypothetical protein
MRLDRRHYGIAATQAYRTYNNATLLNLAEKLWTKVSAYQISQAQAASGTHPTRNISFQATCNISNTRAVSVAGAVFSVRRASRLNVPATHRVRAQDILPGNLKVDQATSCVFSPPCGPGCAC